MAESMEKTIFARRVSDLLEKQNISQRKLCSDLNITPNAFSMYMTTDRMPKADVLGNIANALKTTSDYLLGREVHYDYENLKTILADSKDDLSLNQKNELIDILMKEYKNMEK